ncbi:MAG: hypothetical protein AAB217_17465 [Chloroflexota bacterium]
MKRASLKTAKVPVSQSSGGKDVTDRLLNRGDPTPPKAKSKAPAAPRNQRARTSEVKTMSQTENEPLPYVPYRPVPEQPPAPPPGPTPQPPAVPDMTKTDQPLAQAVEKARQAVEALRIAGRSTPAQYDLAVRYRLDALAHHLEQVAEFLAGRARP